jgi:hypothetical protein
MGADAALAVVIGVLFGTPLLIWGAWSWIRRHQCRKQARADAVNLDQELAELLRGYR